MKKILILLLLTMPLMESCTRSSKTCKQSQKKIKKMRKSGQIKM